MSPLEKADRAFSLYIRERDTQEVGTKSMFRCPTCGQLKDIKEADAGHYISRRVMILRFDEQNVHAQCRFCNRWREGLYVQYRAWLVEKYGESEVENLEIMAGCRVKESRVALAEIAEKYKQKLKDLKESRKSNCGYC